MKQILLFIVVLAAGFIVVSCQDDLPAPAPQWDCPQLQQNYGDVCYVTTASRTDTGVIDSNCICQISNVMNPITYDCPQLQLNYGDPCSTPLGSGTVDSSCNCNVPQTTTYDCPNIMLNFGDPCRTALGAMGTIDSTCNCATTGGGNPGQFDCPNIQMNFGDTCQSMFGTGIIDSMCVCAPINSTSPWDCPNLQLNIGDTCRTALGGWGIVDPNCICR